MGLDIGSIIPTIGNTIGTILGIGMEGHNDRRQVRQQRRLMELEMEGQRKMAEFNQRQQMEMWHNTNYSAQMQELEKAGLNPALMYKQGGAGGTTQAALGNVSGGTAEGQKGEAFMGIGLGLQAQMQQAQIENLKAQTEKTKVDTAKTAGVDTEKTITETKEGGARIEKLKQETTNAKLQEAILDYQKEVAEVEKNIATKTEENIIQNVINAGKKLLGEANSAYAEGKIKNATAPEQIKQIQQATTEQALRIAAQKKNITLTDAQIQKIANDIAMAKQANMQNWDKISQTDKIAMMRKIAEENKAEGFLQELITLISWY